MNNQVIGNIILEKASVPVDLNVIAENNGKVEATGIIQDADSENRNGRIYEEKDLKPEVYSDRIQKELIPTGNMRGHDGHPSSSELSIQSVIDPKLCSVQFTKIWMEGKDIHANFKGTNNELGRAFNADLLEGCKPSFSLRALGSVDRERNGKCYVRNIRIITWDRVIFPSHKRAYTTGFVNPKNEGALTESVSYYGKNANTVPNTVDTYNNGIVIPIVNQQVVDYIKTESANLKDIINTFDTLYESAIICNGGKQVQLTLNEGGQILVNIEQYIQDEIMNYCWNS